MIGSFPTCSVLADIFLVLLLWVQLLQGLVLGGDQRPPPFLIRTWDRADEPLVGILFHITSFSHAFPLIRVNDFWDIIKLS